MAGGPVVFLMGPTGAGKTDLAVELVERLPFDIVSVDSAMVYRGMDIGTGKPEAEVLARAAHRLIDIRNPEQTYSAADFRDDATQSIADIWENQRIPLLVGGTGLYFRTLRLGMSVLPRADPSIRARLAAEAKVQGWSELHRRLAAVDPESASRIHPNDPQRIQRALEVFEVTGEPMTRQLQGERTDALPASVQTLVVSPADRSQLHERIARRFDRMLERGLVDEVRELRSRPEVSRGLASMRAVGYRQAWDYLTGETDFVVMRTQAIAATRQLARRQLTWLRAEPDAHWFDSAGSNLLDLCLEFLGGEKALGVSKSDKNCDD